MAARTAGWDESPAGVGGYLFTSSSAVYPPGLDSQVEDSPWDAPPHGSEEGFAWAKRLGEIQAQLYHRHHHLPVAIVRPANPYGPYDDFAAGRQPVFQAETRLELVPDDGSAGWRELQDRTKQGGVHCAEREL